MTEIVIRIPVSDEMAPLFQGKNVMVMPLSDEEAECLSAALSQVAKTVAMNCKGPNKEAVTLMDYVRNLFGRSVLLGEKPAEGRMQ